MEEAEQDFENHILKIASFIYQVLKDNEKYLSQIPEFYYYQNKYSQKLIKIETSKLDDYICRTYSGSLKLNKSVLRI